MKPEKEIIIVPDDGKTVRELEQRLKDAENMFLAAYMAACLLGGAAVGLLVRMAQMAGFI
ncbi:MAG: hypothetical protein Q4E86_07605 [Lachnospiraceae bacterium]|nr:hypothetical protein [Lachnospiraceae bacterium]